MDLLTLLRDRTRERHARLDAAIDFRADSITTARYIAFLRGVLAVVTPLEPAVAVCIRPLPVPSRVDCVRTDLAHLRVTADTACARLRSPRDLAEAYGCAYVLEGSTLGGLVLARAVEDSLGRNAPTSYLRLRGADTARAWKTFTARLNAFGAQATAEQLHAACASACTTFDAYAASFASSGAIEHGYECTR